MQSETVAEHVQRKLATMHHWGVISGGAYALGCDIADKLTYFAKPECTSQDMRTQHAFAQKVLNVCMELDNAWEMHKDEAK